MKPDLSIIIPCFNEEQNIRLGVLDKVVRFLEKQTYNYEVLIVDDGSSDNSRELIKEFTKVNKNFYLVENTHQGKAATVISGIMKAKYANVLFTDLDQATPIYEIEKLLPYLKNHDIVIGSRQDQRQGAPLMRRLMGPGFMLIRNLILGLKNIEDTQCGFKLFKNEVAKNIFRRLLLFKQQKQISGARVTAGFDVEVLFVAIKLGYKIKEVPVEWHYVDTRRVSPIIDSLDALKDILFIRYLDWKKKYDQP